MKKIFYTIILLSIVLNGKAQTMNLEPLEVTRLKKLITQDKQVKVFYSGFLKVAEQALNEEPNPIETILTEGKLKGDPIKTATIIALQDMNKIYALCLVYRISGDERFLNQGRAYLMAWAQQNRPEGNPINDTNLDPAIDGYGLIKSGLNTADNLRISGWLKATAEKEIASFLKNPKSETNVNNWNSHRLKIIGEIAFVLNDEELKQYTKTGLESQLNKNLNADGSSTDFVRRDALHYHVYDLEPLLKLAIVLKRGSGVDYYRYKTAADASIQKSVSWLIPYMTGEKQHGEFVKSTVDFDRKRADNGESGYKPGTLFEPSSGIKTLALAAYFDPSYNALVIKLRNKVGPYTEWQQILNQIML